ncbi:MAG: aldo/keto reductase [Anaerolineae bacterium]|nr:aldo/keto reductase [Anaerolineae bacterium]
MEYRKMGRTGLRVSALCMGTMQFGWTADEESSYKVLQSSYEAGINFYDTANIYSRWVDGNPGGVAESIIGKWVRNYNIPRDQLVIATKARGRMGEGPNDEGLSRQHILKAVEDSLQRLQTDYIDLYQTHWYDADTPIDETLRALDDLVHQGKVRYLGCSNYPAWRLMEALWVSDRYHLSRYDCLQPHYNLIERQEFEQELAEVCEAYGIGIIPYSPLAGGFLTGKYRRDQTDGDSPRAGGKSRYFSDQNWALLDAIAEIGQEAGGYSVSAVALAWMLYQPGITSPIIGPRNLAQLEENLQAVDFRLTDADFQRLSQMTEWRKSEED